ncbi:MAG: c-type cytochrome [Coriobacteriia bacterium]
MSSNKAIGTAGTALVLVGALGLVVVLALGSTALMPGPLYEGRDAESFAGSLGERIYYTGAGDVGAIPRSGGIGRMGSGGCVSCHGRDGRGGQVGMMMQFAEVPNITYEALTGEHEDEQEGPWDDADIARAIREGELPDGDQLDPIMPRWDMSDREMGALIDYLKTLDGSE